jgi:hypothetical protein
LRDLLLQATEQRVGITLPLLRLLRLLILLTLPLLALVALLIALLIALPLLALVALLRLLALVALPLLALAVLLALIALLIALPLLTLIALLIALLITLPLLALFILRCCVLLGHRGPPFPMNQWNQSRPRGRLPGSATPTAAPTRTCGGYRISRTTAGSEPASAFLNHPVTYRRGALALERPDCDAALASWRYGHHSPRAHESAPRSAGLTPD